MSLKSNKLKFMIIISIAYYIILFTCKFTVFKYFTLSPLDYQINEHCIIIHGQATTGPEIRVAEGEQALLSAIPFPHPDDLNVNEIEMTGKSIFDGILKYPEYYAYDWLIYGEITGTTDQYEICGSGTVPVFEAEKVYPIMPWSDFLKLENIIFIKFPVGIILAFLLYLWPVTAALIIIVKKEKQHT